MFISQLLRVRFVAAVALALVLATAAYGFAESNTMPATSNAGEGVTTVSGYTVSNLAYALNTDDPTKLDKVTFTLTPDNGGAVPQTVKVLLDSSTTTWYDATNVSGDDWKVDFTVNPLTPIAVSTVDAFHLVAHD